MKIHSFQTKLLILFIGLIATVQIATFFAVLATTSHNISRQARDELRVAGRVFHRLLDSRGDELLSQVQIVTSDFAFREVVATRDVATIQSALANSGARVGADVVMLVSLAGELVASTHHDPANPAEFPFPHLLKEIPVEGRASSVQMFQGKPYQFVLVPVYAPAHAAWVSMGFDLDAELAKDFNSLTTLDVSFWGEGRGDYPRFFASTLEPQGEQLLSDALNAGVFGEAGADPFILDGTDQLVLRLPLGLHEGYRVTAIIQTSMLEELAPYHRMKMQMIALALAALILSIIAASVLARSVIRPVQALIAAAREIENGSYSRAVQVDRKDEIGMLATTFNSIVHRAHHDTLTGLPNRAVVGDRLTMSLARAERQGTSFALLMIDLNRFKEINDTLGHLTGDLVLQEIARRLSANSRGTDTVARLGGDEFLVLLEAVDAHQAQEIAQKLSTALTDPVELPQIRISLQVSFGLALYPMHATRIEDLLRRADIAMYHAKQSKTPIAVYQTGQDEKHLRQISLVNDLRQAIDRDELFLHYQPKVALKSGRATQVEALVRWRHSKYGQLAPDDFIPLAEESGQIRALTGWVLRTAIRQCRAWLDQGMDLTVAINLSALDVLDATLPDSIMRILSANDVQPSRLILEITEGAVMRDAAHALQVMNRLKELGIHLAIDDFGIGYSSLAQLKRLPVDEIKIDKSFVMNMQEGDEDAVIVRATIDLAHNMALEVTAEGVETETCWSLLAAYRCDRVQGYLISPPLPAAEIKQWKKRYDQQHQAAPQVLAFGVQD